MTKRSLFLTVAAGLLASVAFATPSQATTVTTAVSFSVLDAGTVNDFEITYTPTVDPISGLSISGIAGGAVLETGPNTLHATFTPVTSAGNPHSFLITFTTLSPSPGFNFSGFSFSGSSSSVSSLVTVSPTLIPEPTSMALLGIGMTGFLAFRRLFKRSSVALTS
jgi:hypothetical protein